MLIKYPDESLCPFLASRSGKVDTLKELLGHSTIEIAHLVNGALRKAVEVADEVFG